jgi:peptide/nickel transport system substrate-binding protein
MNPFKHLIDLLTIKRRNGGKSMKKRFKKVHLMFMLLVLFIAGCSSSSSSGSDGQNSESQAQGDTMKLAWTSQPPTLDPQVTPTNIVRDLARPIFETLVTFDKDYQVVGMLAEKYEVSDDGKTITFTLREGVKFHNDKEMKAEDVVASMQKWQTSSSIAKAELGNSTWEAKDDYTVVLNVENPYTTIMFTLADVSQAAAIMPKEVVEGADASGVKEYIGTGPFKLEEWKFDQYIHFKKFDDYAAVGTPTSGLSGNKEALVNDLYVYFVSDDSTRTNSLVSGEYDYGYQLGFDSYDQISNTPGLETEISQFGMQSLVFNKKEGIFSDVRARQAVNLALDNEELLSIAFVDEVFYELDQAFMRPEQVDWYTDAGKENYNVQDLEEAKRLLKEAGYNGEEVVILTSSDYQHHYNSAIVTQEALQEIGMNVRLEVTEWATLLEKRADPSEYDIFYTSFTTVPTPLQYTFLSSKNNYPGWTNNPEIDRLLGEIKNADSQETSTQKWNELQELIWTDLPIINVGISNVMNVRKESVQGYSEFLGPIFWNTSVSQ